jgi:hypothetical protein
MAGSDGRFGHALTRDISSSFIVVFPETAGLGRKAIPIAHHAVSSVHPAHFDEVEKFVKTEKSDKEAARASHPATRQGGNDILCCQEVEMSLRKPK